MSEVKEVSFVELTANPAPLGLCGFGMTTVLLNLHNAGLFPLDATILIMGLLYGGLAQVIAGIMEWKKNNTFGTVAFTSYGFFWMTLVGIWVLPGLGAVKPAAPAAVVSYLILWGLFSLVLFVATFKLNRALRFTFATLVALFALLVAAKLAESHNLHVIAGYVGLVCGGAALYTAAAQVLNEIYRKKVLPL